MQQVTDDVAKLSPPGDPHRPLDLPAEPVIALQQGDPMTALGRNRRRFQPRRATADHQHLFGFRRQLPGADAVFLLPPGGRGFDTAEPAVQAHSPDAFLIAGQAQTNIVGAVFAGLAGEFGISDLAANDADQIGMTFAQNPFGLNRVLDPPNCDHRQPHCFTDRRGNEQGVIGANPH